VVLQIAQQKAAEVDRLFPLYLGAEGSCTIAAISSTNAAAPPLWLTAWRARWRWGWKWCWPTDVS